MMSPLPTRLAAVLALAFIGVACGGGDDDSGGLDNGKGGKSGSGATGSGGKSPIPVSGGSSGTTSGGTGSGATGSGGSGPYMLPPGYTEADYGGWKLGDPVVEGEDPPDFGVNGSTGCGQEILGIVRDFSRGDNMDKYPQGHPDFEKFTGNGQKQMVLPLLGDDKKPQYNNDAPKTFTTSEELFNEWYNDVEGVNYPFYTFFSLEPANNTASFRSKAFFPIDGEGFGNEGASHNYGFTTEVHTTFRYEGGESFAFYGDDDLWVFINGHLAIDLGGLHTLQEGTVILDDDAGDLGLKKGEVYPLDLFHAERHTSESNFRIDTNLYFVDCGVIVPSGPVK